MKLPSGNEVEVLRLLVGGRELYGLEMIKRSKGALKRGSIYVVLGRMENQGFIKGREVKEKGTPGMPRRLYRISGLGERAFATWEVAQAEWNRWGGREPAGA